MILEKIIALVNDGTDFTNDELESAVKGRDAALIALQRAGLEVEALAAAGGVGDEEVNGVSENIVDLAGEFGTAFKNLTPSQKDKVKGTVAGIITGKNEALIERLFNAALDFVGAAQTLVEVADRLLATPPPPEG